MVNKGAQSVNTTNVKVSLDCCRDCTGQSTVQFSGGPVGRSTGGRLSAQECVLSAAGTVWSQHGGVCDHVRGPGVCRGCHGQQPRAGRQRDPQPVPRSGKPCREQGMYSSMI